MDRRRMKITNIVDEARNVKTFFLDRAVDAEPGQFVMAWIPGKSEKPFSISYDDPLGITVKKCSNPESAFTPALFEKKVGDYLWASEPRGNCFPNFYLSGSTVYLVGGGTGTAPLAYLAEKLKESDKLTKITSFIGARSSEDLIFEKRLAEVGDVIVSTDDGSKGFNGVVTEALKGYNFSKEGKAAVCGPEMMSKYAAELLSERINPNRIYVSVERLMKCGQNFCGSCSFGEYTVCGDGPVFKLKEGRGVMKYEALSGVEDFGHTKLDRCGRKVPV